ncbi:TPA: L-lactate permease [Escherichia coli]|nr:L-lactate permease [Escherichia coli]HCE4124399.1 L-lactate permease [Escherichia coli]
MVTWTQMYMPMGGLGLSALVALIPIIFFFVALAVLRLKGHVAGAITLILSILIAIFAFKMPIDMAFAAAGSARTLLQTPCLVHCNRPRRSKSTSLTLCWWQQIPAAA